MQWGHNYLINNYKNTNKLEINPGERREYRARPNSRRHGAHTGLRYARFSHQYILPSDCLNLMRSHCGGKLCTTGSWWNIIPWCRSFRVCGCMCQPGLSLRSKRWERRWRNKRGTSAEMDVRWWLDFSHYLSSKIMFPHKPFHFLKKTQTISLHWFVVLDNK
jgi:hypothetical protein